MAISITDLVSNLQGFSDDYKKERVDILEASAFNANTLMKSRVIQKRINAEGSVFGNYDPATIKKKGARIKDGDDRINFSDTNRMWAGTNYEGGRGVQPKLISVNGNKVTFKIEPENDQDRIEVLGHLEKRFGPIIAWNKEEQALLITIFDKKLQDLLRKNGL